MKKLISLLPLLLFVILSCAKLNEPSGINDILQVEHVYESIGYARDAYVSPDYVYIAEDQAGFSIFERDSKDKVCQYGEFSTYEHMRLIHAIEDEDLLFVYNQYGGNTGIKVFNIDFFDDIIVETPIAGQTDDVEDMQCRLTTNEEIDIYWSYENTIQYRDYEDETQIAYTFNNPVGGFVIGDSCFYAATEQIGLSIMHRETGEIISDFNIDGRALDVSVVGNYAFLAARESGLKIINIADKENPQLVYEFDTIGLAQSIDATQNYVAVASGGGGIYLFDTSNIDDPKFEDRIDDEEIGYTYKVSMVDNFLFVSTRNGVYKLTY